MKHDEARPASESMRFLERYPGTAGDAAELASAIVAARQLVRHGHALLNGRIVDVPSVRITLSAIALLLVTGCATLDQRLPPPPTQAEIVRMAQDGKSAADMIALMKAARAVYRLPASELAKLHAQGVPDEVIDYMQQTLIEAERYEEYQRTRDRYGWFGWPGYYVRPYSWSAYPYRWYRW